MKRLAALVLFLASAALVFAQTPEQTASASTQVQPASAEKKAVLVFYRPKRFVGSGLTPSVYLNGEQVARLDNGRFFVLELTPGSHKLASSMKHDPLPVEAKAGTVQYFEMIILAGNWRGGGRFIPTGESDAREAVQKLKPLDKKWAMSENVKFALPEASKTIN